MEESQKKQTGKQVIAEICRFLLVGGLATLLDYVIAYLLYRWLLPPVLIGEVFSLALSTAFGFVIGLITNWILSVTFVFRNVWRKENNSSKNAFFRFTVIALIGLGITELGMLLVPFLPSITLFSSTTFLGTAWGWWLMKIGMTCIVLVWNYVGRKLFVFKS